MFRLFVVYSCLSPHFCVLVLFVLLMLVLSVLFLVAVISLPLGAVDYNDCTSADGSPPSNECPGYDTKQSDGEVSAVLKLWRIQSTPSLPLLPGPLWPRMVASDRAISMG